MVAAKFSSKVVDFNPAPLVSLQDVELEENVLGAILLDPNAIAAVESLSVQAFSISAHQEIFKVMLELYQQGLQPDLLTVAFKLRELEKLNAVGGQAKLTSILDRTVYSGNIKQHACLLQEKYYRNYLSDRFSQMAQISETGEDFNSTLERVQFELDRIRNVTSDSLSKVDIQSLDPAALSTTVNSVTEILARGLPDWEEQAHLDALQLQSGISKTSFAQLVASIRCQSDEIIPADEQQLDKLIEWKNAKLDFKRVFTHLAADLLHGDNSTH